MQKNKLRFQQKYENKNCVKKKRYESNYSNKIKNKYPVSVLTCQRFLFFLIFIT